MKRTNVFDEFRVAHLPRNTYHVFLAIRFSNPLQNVFFLPSFFYLRMFTCEVKFTKF